MIYFGASLPHYITYCPKQLEQIASIIGKWQGIEKQKEFLEAIRNLDYLKVDRILKKTVYILTKTHDDSDDYDNIVKEHKNKMNQHEQKKEWRKYIELEEKHPDNIANNRIENFLTKNGVSQDVIDKDKYNLKSEGYSKSFGTNKVVPIPLNVSKYERKY